MRVTINGNSNTSPNSEWDWVIETREGGDYTEAATVKVVACGSAESFGVAITLAHEAASRHFNLCARKGK
jgi:hypothetical protein